MHTAKLGATVQGGKHLAWVQKPRAVEGALHTLLLGEVRLREHLRHEVALFYPHPMLARQHASVLDAQSEDIGTESFRLLELVRIVRVVEDEWMQIAVARMKHI